MIPTNQRENENTGRNDSGADSKRLSESRFDTESAMVQLKRDYPFLVLLEVAEGANEDPTTGLCYVCPGFHEAAALGFAEDIADGSHVCVMRSIINIEAFKAVIDALGHTGGDNVIYDCSQRIIPLLKLAIRRKALELSSAGVGFSYMLFKQRPGGDRFELVLVTHVGQDKGITPKQLLGLTQQITSEFDQMIGTYQFDYHDVTTQSIKRVDVKARARSKVTAVNVDQGIPEAIKEHMLQLVDWLDKFEAEDKTQKLKHKLQTTIDTLKMIKRTATKASPKHGEMFLIDAIARVVADWGAFRGEPFVMTAILETIAELAEATQIPAHFHIDMDDLVQRVAMLRQQAQAVPTVGAYEQMMHRLSASEVQMLAESAKCRRIEPLLDTSNLDELSQWPYQVQGVREMLVNEFVKRFRVGNYFVRLSVDFRNLNELNLRYSRKVADRLVKAWLIEKQAALVSIVKQAVEKHNAGQSVRKIDATQITDELLVTLLKPHAGGDEFDPFLVLPSEIALDVIKALDILRKPTTVYLKSLGTVEVGAELGVAYHKVNNEDVQAENKLHRVRDIIKGLSDQNMITEDDAVIELSVLSKPTVNDSNGLSDYWITHDKLDQLTEQAEQVLVKRKTHRLFDEVLNAHFQVIFSGTKKSPQNMHAVINQLSEQLGYRRLKDENLAFLLQTFLQAMELEIITRPFGQKAIEYVKRMVSGFTGAPA